MLYSMKNVTELYDLSATTIKNYCDLAGKFLSEHATPKKPNGRRAFTYEDLRVFSLIKAAKDYDSAFAALENGERGEVPILHNEYTITIQNKQQIMLLQNRIIQLESEKKDYEDDRKKLIAAEANVNMLEKQLREANLEIRELDKQIDKLKQLTLNLDFKD